MSPRPLHRHRQIEHLGSQRLVLNQLIVELRIARLAETPEILVINLPRPFFGQTLNVFPRIRSRRNPELCPAQLPQPCRPAGPVAPVPRIALKPTLMPQHYSHSHLKIAHLSSSASPRLRASVVKAFALASVDEISAPHPACSQSESVERWCPS